MPSTKPASRPLEFTHAGAARCVALAPHKARIHQTCCLNRMEDLASELPSHMESCDAYANDDNSHLTGELQMLIQEMRLLIASNVFEITISVKKSSPLQKIGGKS